MQTCRHVTRFLLINLGLLVQAQSSEPMTLAQMDIAFKEYAVVLDASPGRWVLKVGERQLIVITDTAANRMRIITPVIEKARLSERLLTRVLEANFESALDARYALYGDYLWSAYIHPLQELTKAQLLDGLAQVAQLAETFGVSYASTVVQFPAQSDDAPATDEPSQP